MQQPDLLCIADLEIDLLRFNATRQGKRLDLTSKKFALLSLLAWHTGKVSKILVQLGLLKKQRKRQEPQA